MVTKQKHRAEHQVALLQESEARYRSIVKASPVSIMAVRNGCFVSVNPACVQMLGFVNPKELIGMPVMNVVASESREMITKRIERLESGKSNSLTEVVLIQKNGERITVESSSVAVLIEGNTTAIVFAYDISRRKKAETELRDSEARLNAFMDNYPSAIYIKNENLEHVYANKFMLDHLGLEHKDYSGTSSHDFFPTEIANDIEMDDRFVLTEGTVKVQEIESVGKKGTPQWFSDQKFPIQMTSGETLIGGISTDITERKQSEEKIEELRFFEQLLSDISTSFIDVPVRKIDQHINAALEQIGRVLGFDRCSLGNLTPDKKKMTVTHVWNVESLSGVRQSYTLKRYPWLLSPFITGTALLWNKSMGLPDGSETDIRLLEESGMQSFAGIPVTVAGELKACLGFSSISGEKFWEPELLARLNHLSRIFGNVLSRKQMDEALQMMQFSIDHSLDRIVWIAPDGQFLYANEAACKEMHATRDQVLSMGVPDVNPDFPQEKWNNHFQNLKKVGSMRLEVQQVDDDGQLHHIDVASNYNNFSGTEFICSFARDITELRNVEQALQKQIKFERLIAELTSNLAKTNQKQLKGTIHSTLEALGQYLKTERCFIGLFSANHSSLSFPYVWAKEGFPTASEIFRIDMASEIPWVLERIRNGDVINAGPDLSALPDEAQGLRRQLERDGINSGLVVPMNVDGRAVGVLGLDTLYNARSYEQPIIGPLEIFANLIGTTFKRIQAENDLREQLGFEDLVSKVSATFINIKASEIDQSIEYSLGLVASFLDVQRCNLLLFSKDNQALHLTFTHTVEGAEKSPQRLFNEQLPWFTKRLLSGEPYCFSSLADLPSEAAAEKAYLELSGVKSAVIIPLLGAGVSHGGITLSSLTVERQWSDKLMQQLKTVADVFSNALLRKRAHGIIEQRLETESLLANLATRFINLAVGETDGYLENAIGEISKQYGFDRSSILKFNEDNSELTRSHMWERDGINSDPHGLAIRVHEQFPGIFDRLRNAKTIIIPDTENLPENEFTAYCQLIGIKSFIMLPLIVGMRNLGTVEFSAIYSEMSFPDVQSKQLRLFSTIVANALARQQTARALEKSQEQTRNLAGRMLSIQEDERKRLARELHDDLSQRLAVLAMSASQVRNELLPSSVALAERIQEMQNRLVEISEDVHAISRQLHPSILEDLGLVDAVRNEINTFCRREGIHIDYRVADIPEHLPKDITLCVFRIIQEGLRNIAKHARADAGAIDLSGEPNRLKIMISDQGCGFDMENSQNTSGLGLISMRERVKMVNGRLTITSAPGNGTRIEAFTPTQASDLS